jgi:hypothetical protein
VLFVTPCAPTAVPLDGSAEVFGAMNNPAACAEVTTDSVCEDGVNASCGNADVEIADVEIADVDGCRGVLPMPLVDELCVCWLSSPPFKLTMPATDMIHLQAMHKLHRAYASGGFAEARGRGNVAGLSRSVPIRCGDRQF